MEASEAPIPPGEEECPSCGRPMSSRARLCPTCHSHRQQWKNWLAFYSGAAGWLAIIVSAVAFVSDVGPRVWNSLFRPDALKPVYFEYPGQSAFVNTGAHDIVLMSIALIVPDGEPLEIELRIGELIKPGEIKVIKLDSQYSEPKNIVGASWVRGNVALRDFDALEIGKPERCSVFHVFNTNHPILQLLNRIDPRPLATFPPVEVFLHEYHTSSENSTTDKTEMRMAIIAISGCVPQFSGARAK
jgi:hypothetical protein